MTPLVLVVEDDADFRRLMTQMLEGWGHTVVAVDSVRQALEHATQLRPDTVVTDVGLPDGDGFALTRQLVAMPFDPRVIVMSSDPGAGNSAAARRAGAIEFLCKDALFRVAIRRLVDA